MIHIFLVIALWGLVLGWRSGTSGESNILDIGGIFPIKGKLGWQGGQVSERARAAIADSGIVWLSSYTGVFGAYLAMKEPLWLKNGNGGVATFWDPILHYVLKEHFGNQI